MIGYAGVSTEGQDTTVQVAALKAASCERIYREKASLADAESGSCHCRLNC
jgi:DNA invertase Pin-like site-specific DNA recombinase